jgi:hypothetical protein
LSRNRSGVSQQCFAYAVGLLESTREPHSVNRSTPASRDCRDFFEPTLSFDPLSHRRYFQTVVR